MIRQLVGNFYGVEVPVDVINPTVIQSHSYFNSPRLEHGTGGIDLPKGEYKFLFLRSQATEEQAKMMVERDEMYPNNFYKLYGSPDYRVCPIATESLESLFQSLNLHGEVAVLEKIS